MQALANGNEYEQTIYNKYLDNEFLTENYQPTLMMLSTKGGVYTWEDAYSFTMKNGVDKMAVSFYVKTSDFDQGAGLTVQDPLHNFIAFESLVMLVVADEAFFDTQVIQQLQRNPGILRGDEVGIFQGFPAAGGDIPQIADGSGNKVKHSSHNGPPKVRVDWRECGE